MTHEDLERFIDAMNAKQLRDRIFSAPLTTTVDFAKVWTKEPLGKAFNEGSYDFYFIKDSLGNYVAAVFDMVEDLHVFVKESHRRQGHLTTSMKTTVFPKFCHDGRGTQKVTFEDSAVGEYCVRNWGFVRTSDSTAELDLSTYATFPPIALAGARFSHEDMADIREKLNRSKLYLKMVREKIELSYGVTDDLSLNALIDEIFHLDDEIECFLESRDPLLK